MPSEITSRELEARLTKGRATYVVDVRDPWERAIAVLKDHHHIPLGELPERLDELKPPAGALTVLYCHHGVRSLAAVAFLEEQGWKSVVSLEGGIDAWSSEVDPKIPVY
jgi:rhodanese-related sulfurtransferase